MKCIIKPSSLPYLSMGLGGVGLILHRWFFDTAIDRRGLLLRSHPLSWCLGLLTLAVLGLILCSLLPLKSADPSEPISGPSPVRALGCLAGAAGILLFAIRQPILTPGYPGLILRCFRILAPPALAAVAASRYLGRRPLFPCHTLVCLFYAFYIVDHYRAWSGDPQFWHYGFPLFAALSLVLYAYYCAAEDAGMGNRRMRLGTGLAVVYLSTVALAAADTPLLYLGSLIWVLTDLCRPEPRVPREEAPHDPA